MASVLSAILTQIVTDIETTSIVKCYIGEASRTAIAYPRAELFLGSGEIEEFLTDVVDRPMPFMLLIKGKTQEQTELAMQELFLLYRSSAKLTVLKALGAINIFATTPSPAEIYAGSATQQPIMASIEFEMLIRYTP